MTTPLVSRGALGFVAAVLAGCVSSGLFAVALNHAETLIFFIVYLTAIPLFLAGLGAGSLAGLLASAAGFADLLIREPSNYAVLYTFVYALPATALTMLALRHRAGADQKTYWYPEGHLVTAMTLYPCALFLLATMLTWGHEGGLLALTHELLDASVESMKKTMDTDSAAQFGPFFDFIAKYMPALASASWVTVTIASMAIAQKVLQQHHWDLRSPFALRDLYMPNWLIIAVAVTGLAGALTNDPYSYTGTNLAIILGLPFLFVGFAVVHAWAHTKKGTAIILTAFYMMLLVMPFLALTVAMLGVADQWVNFRQRFSKQTETI